MLVTQEGDVVEEETPHFHSMGVVYREGGRPVKLLGETKVRLVESNNGPEQELCLIERGYYVKRPDLTTAEGLTSELLNRRGRKSASTTSARKH